MNKEKREAIKYKEVALMPIRKRLMVRGKRLMVRGKRPFVVLILLSLGVRRNKNGYKTS